MSVTKYNEKKISQFNERQHLKRPIPFPMEIKPIGRSLTEDEWTKFCARHLTTKAKRECTRKIDGSLHFTGEGGMDALVPFLEKFKDRFHLRMICATLERAIEGLGLAREKGLNIHEVRYKNGNNEVILNEVNASKIN